MRKLLLKKDEDRRLRAGHLWVFSNEVDIEKSPLCDFAPGEEATLCDARGGPLGSVYVNPASLICGRLYTRRSGRSLDRELLLHRLGDALALRSRLFDAPWYRLCHGEGDFLPGLVIDRYNDHLTVQISTAGMEARRELIEECLDELLQPASLLWDNDLPMRGLEGLGREPAIRGCLPARLIVPENGCVFAAPTADGQKTGWFYDQRVNRREMARYARKADVLDACSYVGGFGVTAIAAGAASVSFLDASAPALETALENAATNTPSGTTCPTETLCGDAFQLLQELFDAGRRFDVVSLDPPAFIKRRKDVAQGLAAYRKFNVLGLQLLRPGGLLVSSSCSHHLPAESLRTCIAQAASRKNLHTRLLFSGGQGPDHPIHAAMPETAYLKCFIAQVSE